MKPLNIKGIQKPEYLGQIGYAVFLEMVFAEGTGYSWYGMYPSEEKALEIFHQLVSEIHVSDYPECNLLSVGCSQAVSEKRYNLSGGLFIWEFKQRILTQVLKVSIDEK